MELLDKIKQEAKKQGLTLRQINDKANLGTNAIYRWKNQTPNINSVKKVAKILNVSVDYLIEKEKPKEHLNVEPILNATQLYFKNTSLSEHDTAVVKNLLRSFLESEEGQQRLRDRGYTGKEKEDKEK